MNVSLAIIGFDTVVIACLFDSLTHCGILQINGWAFYGVLFAHMVCMAVGMNKHPRHGVPLRQISDPLSLSQINPALGIIAFICYSIVVFSSLERFRRHYWGKFYVTHFWFIPGAVCALFHARVFDFHWLASAFFFYAVEVGIRFYTKFMRKSKVEDAKVLPGGVVKLTLSAGATMPYEPGQYVWIALTGVTGAGPLAGFASHPYSISSAYRPGDPTFTIHMKSMGQGTWSEAVLKAVEAQGVDAFQGGCRISWPSGRFAINPVHFERIVVVAGGIGATPLFSLVMDMVRDAAASGAARRYPAAKQITVVWAVQYEHCLSWFKAEIEEARSVAAVLLVDVQLFVTRPTVVAQFCLKSLPPPVECLTIQEGVDLVSEEAPFTDCRAKPGTVDMHHVICINHPVEDLRMRVDCEAKDLSSEDGGQWSIQSGRPDMKEILSAVAASGGTGPVGVFACGPEGMLHETKNAVIALNGGKELSRRFLLHVEVFAF